jgi:hypothetical protein
MNKQVKSEELRVKSCGVALLLAVLSCSGATVERQIDRLLLGTDANGGGNSFTNLAIVNSSNVTARSVTLGGESRTEWPASAAALNLIAGSNIVIVVDGTNYTLHVPSLPWAAISGAPSFDTAGTALAQQQNLSNTVNSIFAATGLANTNYFAASNWVLTISATDMQNLSNTVFNYGFLTATSTQSIFQLGAPNVITETNTFRQRQIFNDKLLWQLSLTGQIVYLNGLQNFGTSNQLAGMRWNTGDPYIAGASIFGQGFQTISTGGTYGVTVMTNGVRFADGTTQTTAAVSGGGGITNILSSAGPVTTNSATSVTIGSPTNSASLLGVWISRGTVSLATNSATFNITIPACRKWRSSVKIQLTTMTGSGSSGRLWGQLNGDTSVTNYDGTAWSYYTSTPGIGGGVTGGGTQQKIGYRTNYFAFEAEAESSTNGIYTVDIEGEHVTNTIPPFVKLRWDIFVNRTSGGTNDILRQLGSGRWWGGGSTTNLLLFWQNVAGGCASNSSADLETLNP